MVYEEKCRQHITCTVRCICFVFKSMTMIFNRNKSVRVFLTLFDCMVYDSCVSNVKVQLQFFGYFAEVSVYIVH